MRLIDADTLPCDICDFQKCPCFNPLWCRDFNRWFKATAFDVDKVIEEIDRHSIDNTDWSYSTNPKLASYYLLRTEDAIKIVKRGGVDDNGD